MVFMRTERLANSWSERRRSRNALNLLTLFRTALSINLPLNDVILSNLKLKIPMALRLKLIHRSTRYQIYPTIKAKEF